LGKCCLLLSTALTHACAGHAGPNAPTSSPNPSRMASSPPIAQPCTLTPVARQLDPESGFPAAYVELAAVATTKGSPMPLPGQRPAGFLNTSDLQVLRVGSVMTKVGASATTAWDEAQSASNEGPEASYGKQSRFDLTVTLHQVDLVKRQLKLELTIVPAPPLGTPKDAWYVPDHRQMHTTAIIGDQQPMMLGGDAVAHRDTPSILVATPYIVSSPEHLNELFQCRMSAMSKPRAK